MHNHSFSLVTKQCTHCSKTFNVDEADQAFYHKLDVPAPTHCPDCRQQRRMSWRNELHLHKRTCDSCKQLFITTFRENDGYTVYCGKCWFSDNWDPTQYGREFDFSRPFFEQFNELMHVAPQLGMYGINNENSDYTQSTSYLKNCYMMSSANRCEDSYYGSYVNDSKNCIDNLMIRKCELCYECVECEGCYECFYAKNSTNCTNSYFIENCTSCTDCFGCINLVRKQYCWFNEQLTKEEYERRLQEVDLSTVEGVAAMRKQFDDFKLKHPQKYYIGHNNEEVSGNSIVNSKNAKDCFDVTAVENSSYCYWLNTAKDCMDVFSWGFPAELCYECTATGDQAYHNRFCMIAVRSKELQYSNMCFSSEYLFGCSSVQKGKYMILNKQFTETEYHAQVAKIVEHMKQTGEYGEYFPMRLSPYPYNESVVNVHYPLQKQEVEAQGLLWSDALNTKASQGGCVTCGRAYQLIPQELEFYKQYNLPKPHQCFLCRHQARIEQRLPRKLWNRQCMCTQIDHRHAGRCATAFETGYAPDRKELIYCEPCYQKEIV